MAAKFQDSLNAQHLKKRGQALSVVQRLRWTTLFRLGLFVIGSTSV